MHDLFTNVLSKRDLSIAGDLFSVADAEIVNDLNEVLTKIETIIINPDYLQNKNDQSVVEICITRITSCIRETKTAERHCTGLVILLESCLKHNLQPSNKNEDHPPHAKICADIISSIFLNYNKKAVMQIALPVAVKFLQKGNKELSRNLASYLSLAAIDYASLISPHVLTILDSIISGNYGLCRLLPQIYKVSPEPLTNHGPLLVALLQKCDVQEKLALLNLFELIAKNKPTVLENSVPQLCEFLMDPATISATMLVLLKMAEERPNSLLEHFNKIKLATKNNPTSITLAAKVLSSAGKVNKERAQFALNFVLEQLTNTDRTSQTILLNEVTKLCSCYPILFDDKVLACVRKRNNMSQKQLSSQNEVNKTSGGVTIVKLNSPPTQQQQSQTPTIITQHKQSSLQSPQMSVSSLTANQNSTIVTTSNSTITTTTITPVTTTTTPSLTTVQGANTTTTASPTSATTLDINHTSHVTTTVINTSNTIVQHKIGSTGGGIVHNIVTIPPTNISNPNSGNHSTATPPHSGYTRRAKLGDSRSTGRLHSHSGSNNTHRSMTRLNIAGGSSVGGLHKSMTRLSSSQQINQNNGSNSNNVNNCNSSGNVTQVNGPTTSHYGPTPVPPLSSNVIVTGHNKWGIPSTKITSGGVTVTTSPPRIRPHSQGPSTLLGSSGALGKGSSNGVHNQSTGSIGLQQNSVSVHHASPASPTFGTQQSVIFKDNTTDSKILHSLTSNNNNQVSISGPLTVTSRRNDNTSVTLLNSNNTATQRMSVFEPYLNRDTIQHFCEKHLDKIKTFMSGVSQQLPPAAKCTIEERRSKKLSKLHFACQMRGPHCLYSKTFFTMRTRNPRTWIHLMFLDLQARAQNALSSRDPSVSSLRHCWDILKCENKSFITLVTSAFPMTKDQDALVNELRHSGFFDVFELGPVVSNGASSEDLEFQWACFLCNHPEKAMGFLHGNTQPVIEGQLKEKKGKFRFFRRWRTRYFTLSGAHLSCKNESGGESIDINQIRSVKVSRGPRNIPKAFEIFTGDQTLILKPKDGKNAEEWVQYLSIVVAHSQARDTPNSKTNSLPARNTQNIGNVF